MKTASRSSIHSWNEPGFNEARSANLAYRAAADAAALDAAPGRLPVFASEKLRNRAVEDATAPLRRIAAQPPLDPAPPEKALTDGTEGLAEETPEETPAIEEPPPVRQPAEETLAAEALDPLDPPPAEEEESFGETDGVSGSAGGGGDDPPAMPVDMEEGAMPGIFVSGDDSAPPSSASLAPAFQPARSEEEQPLIEAEEEPPMAAAEHHLPAPEQDPPMSGTEQPPPESVPAAQAREKPEAPPASAFPPDRKPREAPEPAAAPAPPFRMRLPSWITGLWSRRGAVVVAASFLILLAGYFGLPGRGDGVSSGGVARLPALDKTPSGEIQRNSPEYRETLETANDAGAREALESGGSFIPTPEALPGPSDPSAAPESGTPPADAEPAESDPPGRRTVPPPPPAPPADSVWLLEGSAPPPSFAERADPFAPSSSAEAGIFENPAYGYLAALADRQPPRMGGRSLAAAEPPMSVSGPVLSAPPSAAPVPPADTHGIRPGDLLHAEMVNSLNSDLPGPAVAEIVEGPLRGARLTGGFTPLVEHGGLALRFTSLHPPGGGSVPVDAYGLSPFTGQALTRSKLEPRLLQRFGPSVLTALLSGAAASASSGGQRLVVLGDSIAVERGRPSDREIIASGVTAAASGLLRSYRPPSGPRILLEAGSPVVILFAGTGGAATPPAAPPPAPPAFPPALPPALPPPDLPAAFLNQGINQ